MTRINVGIDPKLLVDKHLLAERISERLKTMKNLKYKQQPISVEDAIALLKKEKK